MGKKSSAGNLELRHLRYFLAIADEMNFGQAAERLDIAQPGLSQQIKMLEQILDVTLFDRSRRRLRMTLAGEMFEAEARKIMAQVERAIQTAQRAGRGEVGRLAIGYVGSAAYTGMLTNLVGDFRGKHPLVDLEISEIEMLHQLEAIAEGRLDIGFIRPPVPLPEGVSSVPVMTENLLIALPGVHRQAGREAVSLCDLSDESFITPQHPPLVSFHAHTVDACASAGFEPRLGMQGRDFMTIASMVSVGLGVALVPQSVRCIQLPNVVYRPLVETLPRAELSVAFRRGDASMAVRNFIALARKFSRSA
ncbi:MAG: LysR substrate-binding domain-containing protein [Shinella sp.]|nr:LysR substrate-binding domain-containing protein [Shinella sp.]